MVRAMMTLSFGWGYAGGAERCCGLAVNGCAVGGGGGDVEALHGFTRRVELFDGDDRVCLIDVVGPEVPAHMQGSAPGDDGDPAGVVVDHVDCVPAPGSGVGSRALLRVELPRGLALSG